MLDTPLFPTPVERSGDRDALTLADEHSHVFEAHYPRQIAPQASESRELAARSNGFKIKTASTKLVELSLSLYSTL